MQLFSTFNSDISNKTARTFSMLTPNQMIRQMQFRQPQAVRTQRNKTIMYGSYLRSISMKIHANNRHHHTTTTHNFFNVVIFCFAKSQLDESLKKHHHTRWCKSGQKSMKCLQAILPYSFLCNIVASCIQYYAD